MSAAIRVCVFSILLGLGLAGCTPAAFVQRARPAQPCEVKMCVNPGSGMERCHCKTHDQVARQTRHAFWPHTQ